MIIVRNRISSVKAQISTLVVFSIYRVEQIRMVNTVPVFRLLKSVVDAG